MMKFSIFGRIDNANVWKSADLDGLANLVHRDSAVKMLTLKCRDPKNDGIDWKKRMRVTCLGGSFGPIDVERHRDEKRHNARNCRGYRNEAHIDWTARTGLVSVDLDNLQDAGQVQYCLQWRVPEIATSWISARGRGLKLGVLVNPIPTNGRAAMDAWTAAVAHIIDELLLFKLEQNRDYKIDQTHALVHASIISHDEPSQTCLLYTSPSPRDS